MRVSIYALTDPDDPEHVRYIGMSRNDLVRRLKGHIAEAATDSQTHKSNWIRKLISAGRTPVIRCVVEVDSEAAAMSAERERIGFYKRSGHKLTNATEGGEGLWTPTPEICNRKSAAFTKYLKTAKAVGRQRNAALCRWKDRSQRDRAAISMRRQWIETAGRRETLKSEDYRQRRSDIATKLWSTHDYREKASAAQRARTDVRRPIRPPGPLSEQHKANISKALRARAMNGVG